MNRGAKLPDVQGGNRAAHEHAIEHAMEGVALMLDFASKRCALRRPRMMQIARSSGSVSRAAPDRRKAVPFAGRTALRGDAHLIDDGPAIERVRIEHVGFSPAHWLRGPTGVGKAVVAGGLARGPSRW